MRKPPVDSIERERLIQSEAVGDLMPEEKELARALRAENPSAWDSDVAAYRKLSEELYKLSDASAERPRGSPLAEALAQVEEQESKREKFRRQLDDRIIRFGLGAVAARATDSVMKSLVGTGVTLRGIRRVLSAFNSTVNIVLFQQVVVDAASAAVGSNRKMIDVEGTEPGESS